MCIGNRYLGTAWAPSMLEAQVATGAVLQYFFSYPEVQDDQVQGTSIHPEARPTVSVDDTVRFPEQVALWAALGHAYRPSVVYTMNLRLDSIHRVAIRRVREKINVFRKVEG